MNHRPLLSAGLALALTAALFTSPVLGANRIPPPDEAAQVVHALGIMVGDANGDMGLHRIVNRAEFITMAIKATPNGEQIGQASTSPYPDVPFTHWAAGYVEAGVNAGLISGYSDGTFRPANPITLAEGVTIVLQLLGYGPQDFSGSYPTPQMAKYRSLDLDQGVLAQNPTDPLTRHDAMYLFYQMLSTKTKGGTPYLHTLGYTLNQAGEIDLVSIINDSMSGPIVAQGGWQSGLPFDPSGAKVYRDGKPSSLSGIQTNDIIYWNTSMNTLWAYANQVVGVIQELLPSPSSPNSVKISGRTYPIETSAAAYDLSSLGPYGVGDTVTLLLGRDKGVAAVIPPNQAVRPVLGLVAAVDRGSYPDGHGGSYITNLVTLLSTDGQTYQYPWDGTQFQPGNLVEVTPSSSGQVDIRRLSETPLSGTISSDGSRLDSTPLAPHVEILDVYQGTAKRIYPDRLAGLTLNRNQVAYYSKDTLGQIDRLILKDVTGDMHSYGILTKFSSTGEQFGLGATYSYEYDIGGIPGGIPVTTTYYPVQRGPILIKGGAGAPDKLLPLTPVSVSKIQDRQLISGNLHYTLWDEALVYELRGDRYYLSSLDRIQDTSMALTGWYDKPESEGGRIRLVIAQNISQ